VAREISAMLESSRQEHVQLEELLRSAATDQRHDFQRLLKVQARRTRWYSRRVSMRRPRWVREKLDALAALQRRAAAQAVCDPFEACSGPGGLLMAPPCPHVAL
jgi:hypothetical protein